MYCGKCGTELPDGSLFCANCGAPQAEPPASEPSFPAPDAQEPINPPPDGGAPRWEPYQNPYQSPGGAESFRPAPPEQWETQTPKPKKHRGRRIVITFAAVLLAASLIAVGVAYALVWSQPEWKIGKAMEKSGDAFSELFENAEEFNRMLENAEKIENEYSLEMLYQVGSYEYSQQVSFDITADYSEKEERFAAHAEMNLPDNSEIALDLYADDENLTFQLPGITDAYSVPTERFGDRLCDWLDELGVSIDPEVEERLRELEIGLFDSKKTVREDFQEQYADQVKAVEDGIEVEKSNRKIPGADADLTVYSIRVDWDAIADLTASYFAYLGGGDRDVARFARELRTEMSEVLGELDLRFLVGVNEDGYLTAFYLYHEDGDFALLLEGKDNPWEEFRLCSDGRTVMTGSVEKTRDGCVASLTSGGETLELELDDSEGELVLSFEGTELLKVTYSAEDRGMNLSFQAKSLYNWLNLELHILPYRGAEPLSDDPIDLFSLDREDLQDIAEDITESIQRSYRS